MNIIKLKNGIEIEYQTEFDQFFQNLLDTIVHESYRSARNIRKAKPDGTPFNDIVLKEVMDNCIYVTHQLFEIAKENEALSKFIVTGFLFNSVVLSISHLQEPETLVKKSTKKDSVH